MSPGVFAGRWLCETQHPLAGTIFGDWHHSWKVVALYSLVRFKKNYLQDYLPQEESSLSEMRIIPKLDRRTEVEVGWKWTVSTVFLGSQFVILWEGSPCALVASPWLVSLKYPFAGKSLI